MQNNNETGKFWKQPTRIALFCAALLLAGCGTPRPLTMQEQDAWMLRQQCSQEATNVNPDFPGPDNPMWSSYFVMCMQSMGVSDAALERMWW